MKSARIVRDITCHFNVMYDAIEEFAEFFGWDGRFQCVNQVLQRRNDIVRNNQVLDGLQHFDLLKLSPQ